MESEFLVTVCHGMDKYGIQKKVDRGEFSLNSKHKVPSLNIGCLTTKLLGGTKGVSVTGHRILDAYDEIVTKKEIASSDEVLELVETLNEDCQRLIMLELDMKKLLVYKSHIRDHVFETFCAEKMKEVDRKFEIIKKKAPACVLQPNTENDMMPLYIEIAIREGCFDRRRCDTFSKEYLGLLWDQYMHHIKRDDYVSLLKSCNTGKYKAKYLVSSMKPYIITLLTTFIILIKIYSSVKVAYAMYSLITWAIPELINYTNALAPLVGDWFAWIIKTKIRLYLMSCVLSYTGWRGTSLFYQTMELLMFQPFRTSLTVGSFVLEFVSKCSSKLLITSVDLLYSYVYSEDDTKNLKERFVREFMNLGKKD